MNEGFIPALGTPLDSDGGVIVDSYRRHVADAVDAGAAALLAMGTMGIGAFVGDAVYPEVARHTVEEADGRVPVLVGAMDNSIRRVTDRAEAASAAGADGIVITAPYYHATTREERARFFRTVARRSPVPLYLYDLPGVARVTLDPELVLSLVDDGVRGIKTGTLPLARALHRRIEAGEVADFAVIYSDLDTMDVAWSYGIRRVLDGMFSCTLPLIRRAMETLGLLAAPGSGGGAKEVAGGAKEVGGGATVVHSATVASDAFDRIITLRDFFVGRGVFRGFTAAMNLLGYRGSFGPDYTLPVDEVLIRETGKELAEVGITAGA